MKPSPIPYGMFDLQRSAEEARRAHKLRNIYHAGQDLIWDGQQVLSELLQKHGGVHVAPHRRRAIGRIFTVLMWGELAAWRISAQLADAIEPLEPKMAASSQVHDEARHFFVMHDYLEALGYPPGRMDPASQALLDLVLLEEDLTLKLMGMQLMVESIAVTIFRAVRKARVEPVLAELMTYYERDEARHIGLGVQYLPERLKGISPVGLTRMTAYNLRLVWRALRALAVLEEDFETLGIDANQLNRDGFGHHHQVLDDMWTAFGRKDRPMEELVGRVVGTVAEAWFPPADKPPGLVGRYEAAVEAWQAGGLRALS